MLKFVPNFSNNENKYPLLIIRIPPSCYCKMETEKDYEFYAKNKII